MPRVEPLPLPPLPPPPLPSLPLGTTLTLSLPPERRQSLLPVRPPLTRVALSVLSVLLCARTPTLTLVVQTARLVVVVLLVVMVVAVLPLLPLRLGGG